MKIAKALAVAGLIVSSNAMALPVVGMPVPESSVQECVAEIATQANYEGAGAVRHDVDSRSWRASGHKISIKTSVYGSDSSELIREYETVCSVSDSSEVQRFDITEQS